MYRYAVGSLYNPSRTRWPEAAQYNYRGGEHELVLFLAGPSKREVEAVRKAAANFALVVEPPVLLLCYRFGDGIPWSDAPFSWHLVPEAERQLPPDPEIEERALLHVILVDAATGIIRALRANTLSPTYTAALHRAIRAQAAIPWDQQRFDATLNAFYARHTSADLAAASKVRCQGGE